MNYPILKNEKLRTKSLIKLMPSLLLILLMVLLMILIILYNFKATLYNCFSTNDLGIYGQAIIESAHNLDWNPWVTVRGVYILNDHFDPIVLSMIPFARWFNYKIQGILVLEIGWWIATLILLNLIHYQWCAYSRSLQLNVKWNLRSALFLSFIFITCRGILLAITFPIHTTTWSMLAMVLLVYTIYNYHKNELPDASSSIQVVLASFFICLFREEFPFAILALSFYYFLRSSLYLISKDSKWNCQRSSVKGPVLANFKLGVGLFILAILMIVFIFYIRPKWWGPTEKYGDGIVSKILNSPVSALIGGASKFNWGSFSIYYPFIIPLGFLFFYLAKRSFRQLSGTAAKESIGMHIGSVRLASNVRSRFLQIFLQVSNETPLLPVIFLLSPLILIRFITGQFAFHYSAPVMGALLSVIALSELPLIFTSSTGRRKWWLVIVTTLFMVSSLSIFTKCYKLVCKEEAQKCVISTTKRQATTQVLELVKKENITDRNKTILSTGGIIPQLISPGRKIYHLGGVGSTLNEYDYLLIEKNNSGDIWPLNNADIEQILKHEKKCREKVIINNSYYYFAAGKFSKHCWH